MSNGFDPTLEDIGYDLNELALAGDGVDPDIPGVTSRLGTPVDRLGAATILGDAGIPLEGGLTLAQSLASLARIDPQLARDIMSGRTYMAGTGLLGQGDMEDPFLQQISLTGNEQGDTINLGQRMGETHDDFLDRIMAQEDFEKTLESITPTISKSLVKDAQDKLSKIYDKDYTEDAIRDRLQGATTDAVRSLIDPEEYDAILPETPPGTTDIFNSETGKWEAVYDQLDRPSETSFVDTQVTDVGDDILSGTQSFEVETPSGTTDIFDTETGEWTALTKTEDEKTEEEKINSLINQLRRPKVKEGQAWRKSAETELQKALALEEETTVLAEEEDESVFQKVIAETLGLPVDTINAVISSILRAAGAPDKIIENPVGGRAWLMENKGMTIDGLVAQIGEMLTPTTSSGIMDSWPTIPTVQDTQADVMDEGYLAGLNMTAEESRALTRELNTLGRPRLDHEIEALKQGASIAGNLQTQKNLEDLQESPYSTGFLEGLSQAMKNVLENDDDLMAQYMAARSDIISQLDKTKFEHEEFYPGSQAAAVGAGYWGPLALGWNASYNDYKDAQRALMGKQAGQRFDSGDWINNLGWMTPEQINRLLGYGEP